MAKQSGKNSHTGILLFSVLIFFSFTCVEAKPHIPSAMDSIEFFIKDFQYEKALVILSRKIKASESSAEQYYLKGIVLKGLFKFDQAIDSYLDALSLDSLNNQILVELAVTYRQLPDYNNSLKYFQLALKNDSNNLVLQIERANCKYYMDLFKPAIVDFHKIYQKDTLNYFAIKRLALCYNKLNQNDSAINFYKKAIRLNPHDAGNVINLCNLLINQKKYSEGIRFSEAYRALDSTNNNANSQNAYLQLLNKNYRLSISKFKICLQNKDTSEFVYKNIGIAYFKLGNINNFDTSKYFFEKAYVIDTMDINTLHFLGLACAQSFYKNLGVYYLEKAAKQYSLQITEYAMIYLNLAEACRTWSKCPCEKTLSVSLKAYELNPQDSLLIYHIAFGYDYCKNDKENAIAYYEKFLHTKPPVIETDKIVINNYDIVEMRLKELRKKD